MLGAFPRRAELRVGEPDALDAVALVQRLDFLGDLIGVAVALAVALDLVVEAEMALERAAALGVHADVAVQVVPEGGKNRFDIAEIDRGQPGQLEGLAAVAVADRAARVLVEEFSPRRDETVDDRQHGVLALADDDHGVGRAFLGNLAGEDRDGGAADDDARLRQQSAGQAEVAEVAQPAGDVVADDRQRVLRRLQPVVPPPRMVEVHHHVERVILRMRPERLHVAPGERDDVGTSAGQPLGQGAGAVGGGDDGQVEDVLLDLRPLLVHVVGDVDHAAGIDLPARQADIQDGAGGRRHRTSIEVGGRSRASRGGQGP